MYPVKIHGVFEHQYPGSFFIKITEPKDPGALIQLRDSEQQEVKTAVCGNCGYIEFYADNAKRLWNRWQKGYR